MVDENTLQLAHGSAIELDARGTDPNATQTLARINATTFEAANAVDALTNVITLPGHGLTNGQRVSYHTLTSDGAAIGGLSSGADYFVLRVDADHIKLGTDIEPEEGAFAETFTAGTSTYYEMDLENAAALKTTVNFDPTGTTANGEPVFDDATDSIVFDVDHDFYTGQPVIYTAATPITGLTSGGTYYIIKVAGASDRVQLALSKANAEAEAPVPIVLGPGAGVGSQSLTGRHLHALVFEEAPLAFNPQDAINDADTRTTGNDDTNAGTTLAFDTPHGLQTGDAVVYRVDPSLLHEVGVNSHTSLEIADVVMGNINPAGLTVDGESVVDTAQGTISFDGSHPFVTGQRVTYSSGGGTPIGGLADGDYFVIDGAPGDFVSTNKLRLAMTREDAFAGNAIVLTGTGSGTQHSFTANAVDKVDDLLIVQNNSFHTGQKVRYSAVGNAPVGGLVDNTDYYVIRVPGTSDMIQLAATLADASAHNAY